MKPRILLAIALSLGLCFFTRGQGLSYEFSSCPDRAGSNHYAYPYPTETLPQLTAAHDGYEPFFMSHYGRHGSRWLTSEKSYTRPVAVLEEADRNGALNETGKRLLDNLRYVATCAKGRIGELSDVGAEQHHGIARRMCRNFPEIFMRDGAAIDAKSTIVIRCILSMLNATGEIKANNPSAVISTDASMHDMHYMGWGKGEDTLAVHIRNELKPLIDSLFRQRVKPQNFLKRIFNDEAYASTIDGQKLMEDVFDIACTLQNHHVFDNMSLYGLFTTAELEQIWQYKNIYWYVQWANAPQAGNRTPFIERALLNNFVASIDDAIERGTPGAALRYGHETCLLPLACLMQLDDVNYSCNDLDRLQEHWRNYDYFPMACNIQVIAYRKKGGKKDDTLVKVLYNEHEAHLPIGTDAFPYYKWNDVRKFWLDKTATKINWAEHAAF